MIKLLTYGKTHDMKTKLCKFDLTFLSVKMSTIKRFDEVHLKAHY